MQLAGQQSTGAAPVIRPGAAPARLLYDDLPSLTGASLHQVPDLLPHRPLQVCKNGDASAAQQTTSEASVRHGHGADDSKGLNLANTDEPAMCGQPPSSGLR